MTRVLITGGAGFIGHHLAHALVARGVGVTVLDDLSMGRRGNVPAAARFVEGDVRDPAAVRTALEGVDAVLHEAAIVSIRASVEHFVRDAEVNLMGTLNLLQQMAGRPIGRAVLASSMAVYADRSRPEPLAEDAPTEPIAPYGAAKLAAERYWRMMGAQTGVPATVLRYFNTYGPNQTFTPYVGVITIFIHRLLAGQPPVIFGDGEQRRDFVHVDDIVRANLDVLDAPDAAVDGRVFNVGTGRATSVNEVAAGLIAVIAPGTRPEYAPAQPGELRNAIADPTALAAALGWSPQRGVDFADVVEFWRGRTS
ncbi:MAG TPA: SDR family NAD(P)-dependent oxidoreductase [Candidatus Dormibacteraeota bacterium]|nr:SDR family NAD(P)-dependent oxidoreductase [Candidatus Dormibacteraeota bacterium]